MAPQTRSGGGKRESGQDDKDKAAKVARTGRVGGEKKKEWQLKKSQPSALKWLLSDEAAELANPDIPSGHGEVDLEPSDQTKPAPQATAGKQDESKDDATIIRYPQSTLTPFQNLVAACVLSKPISHRLGMRTIHTLFNPPFGLRTLSDLDAAGFEGRRRALWEARTQHKEKTAKQLGDVVEGVRELCGSVDTEEDLSELKAVQKIAQEHTDPQEAAQAVADRLTDIKGIGPGVASIFLRRVQQDWKEVFPYADDKSLANARKFSLIGDKEGAKELSQHVNGDRAQFVRLLDTLVGLDLEKVVDKALERVQRESK